LAGLSWILLNQAEFLGIRQDPAESRQNDVHSAARAVKIQTKLAALCINQKKGAVCWVVFQTSIDFSQEAVTAGHDNVAGCGLACFKPAFRREEAMFAVKCFSHGIGYVQIFVGG
jgi:uncharacterized protein (DUF2141 family)